MSSALFCNDANPQQSFFLSRFPHRERPCQSAKHGKRCRSIYVDSDIDILSDCIEADGAIESGKYGDKVSHWIGNMVAKAADGSWNVSIATAGNLLASAITKFYAG